jgi:hypothetical protein
MNSAMILALLMPQFTSSLARYRISWREDKVEQFKRLRILGKEKLFLSPSPRDGRSGIKIPSVSRFGIVVQEQGAMDIDNLLGVPVWFV